MVEKQLLLFSISLKIESKLKEINSKMSYFDKKDILKTHILLIYSIVTILKRKERVSF